MRYGKKRSRVRLQVRQNLADLADHEAAAFQKVPLEAAGNAAEVLPDLSDVTVSGEEDAEAVDVAVLEGAAKLVAVAVGHDAPTPLQHVVVEDAFDGGNGAYRDDFRIICFSSDPGLPLRNQLVAAFSTSNEAPSPCRWQHWSRI